MVATRTAGPSPRLISGKYVLLVVVALGLAGAGGGWWYQQSLQRRPLQLWGHQAASLMLHASDIEICRLEPASGNDPIQNTIAVGGVAYQQLDCIDASRIPGFLHLRHSLLNDYSFDWSDAASGNHGWRYAIRFRDGAKTATLLISADFSFAMLVETGAKACIEPIAEGIGQVFGEAWVRDGIGGLPRYRIPQAIGIG